MAVKVDRPAYLLDSPRLPSGHTPSPIAQANINTMREYFNRLDSEMPAHILSRQR